MRKRVLSTILIAGMLVLSACGPSEIDTKDVAVPEVTEGMGTVVEEPTVEYEVKGDALVTPMNQKTMYATTNANIRKGPSTANEAIGTLVYGEAVTVDGFTEYGWYRISYGGKAAYVSKKLLQDSQPVVEEAADTSAAATTVYTSDYCTGLAKEIFDATNAERAKAGLPALIWDDRLASPASVRAQEIITKFSHERADGTKCYALSNLIYGENIARGPHATGAEFLAHWMASEGHKANILRSEYKTMGVGFTCTEQGDTAVQLFGVE